MSGSLAFGDEERQGWFKLVIPAIEDVFGQMLIKFNPQQPELVPFIYCRLDSEEVAFDDKLSQPMLALDKVCLVQVDAAKRTVSNSKVVPVTVIGLSIVSSEHEGRCYIPAALVSCIIPVKPDHAMINALLTTTSESQLITPTVQEAGTILNLPSAPEKKS